MTIRSASNRLGGNISIPSADLAPIDYSSSSATFQPINAIPINQGSDWSSVGQRIGQALSGVQSYGPSNADAANARLVAQQEQAAKAAQQAQEAKAKQIEQENENKRRKAEQDRIKTQRQETETARHQNRDKQERDRKQSEKPVVNFNRATTLDNLFGKRRSELAGVDSLFNGNVVGAPKAKDENTHPLNNLFANTQAKPSIFADMKEGKNELADKFVANKVASDQAKVEKKRKANAERRQKVKQDRIASEQRVQDVAPELVRMLQNDEEFQQDPKTGKWFNTTTGQEVFSPEKIVEEDYLPRVHYLDEDVRDMMFNHGFSIKKKEADKLSEDQLSELMDELSVKISENQNRYENPDRYGGPNQRYTMLEEFNKNHDIEVNAPTVDDLYNDNLEDAQQEMIDFIFNSQLLKIEGMKDVYDPETDTVVRKIPEKIQPMIVQLRSMYRCSISDVFELVELRVGLGIDSKHRLVGNDPAKYQMTQREFMLACDEIIRSQNQYGHPLHIVSSELRIGGTRCFPMGYMPRSLAIALTQSQKSVFYKKGIDAYSLIEKVQDTWIRNTQPNIILNTQTAGKPQQRHALDNMMRAICAMDGLDATEEFNIPEIIHDTFTSMLQAKQDALNTNDETMIAVAEKREEEFQKLTMRLWKSNYSKKGVFNENGDMVLRRRSRLNDACNMIASWERLAGVVGNPPLMVSGYMEHAQGLLDTKAANFAYSKLPWAHVGKNYKMTEFTKEAVKTKEAAQAAGLMERLYNLAGADAVKAFGLGLDSKRYDMTPIGVAKFIEDWIQPRREKEPGRFASKAKEIDTWYRNLMEGNWLGMRGADCKRMMEMALINNAIRANFGEASLDANEVDRLINKEGIASTMFKLASTDEGFDAFISMSNLNLGRRSPASYIIEKGLRKIGPVNAVITTFFETYLTYGFNLVQLYFPFSNVASYLATTGFKSERGVYQYQLGGYKIKKAKETGGKKGAYMWLDGLTECFMYDFMKCANTLAYTALCMCWIQAMGGLEDPPEEGLMYNWLEYRVGIKGEGIEEIFGQEVDFKEEDGKIFVPAWWMNDLTCYGMPLAVACLAQKNHPERPGLGLSVLLSGTGDMLQGSAVIDLLELISHPEDQLDVLERQLNGDEIDISEAGMMRLMAWGALDQLTKKMTPAVVRDFFPGNMKDTFFVGQDALNHSAAYVYNSTDYTPEEARSGNYRRAVTDPEEAFLRRRAKNNPLLAVILNVSRNGYLFDNGHREKTGYLFSEMPIVSTKDQVRSAYAQRFDFDLDNPLFSKAENKEYFEQAREQSYSALLDDIAQYGSLEEAMAHGFWINPEDRISAIAKTYDILNYLDEEWTLKVEAGGMTSAEYYAAKQYYNDQSSMYWDLLNNWIGPKTDLPWRDEGYALLISDWETQYNFKGTNEPATIFNYIFEPGAVEKRYVPLGNSKTSYLPFTQVHDENRGYNFETISNWYDKDLTDTQRVYDNMKGVTVPYGRDMGRLVNNSVFGGTDEYTFSTSETNLNIKPGTNEPTTMNQRAWVPYGDPLEYYLTDDQILRYGLEGVFGLRSEGNYKVNESSSNGSGASGGSGDEGTPESKDGTGFSVQDLDRDLIAKAHNKPTAQDLKDRRDAVFNGDSKGTKPGGNYYGGAYGTRYTKTGRYYSSGSGTGTSSYNPKIYSMKTTSTHITNQRVGSARTNPLSRNVNANRAADLRTPTPQDARMTNLRPGFSTKGSREAYKRSDI